MRSRGDMNWHIITCHAGRTAASEPLQYPRACVRYVVSSVHHLQDRFRTVSHSIGTFCRQALCYTSALSLAVRVPRTAESAWTVRNDTSRFTSDFTYYPRLVVTNGATWIGVLPVECVV